MAQHIAGRIKALREQRGWSKLELARRVGGKNPRTVVYRWESGKTVPTVESLRKLAEIFTAGGCGTVTGLDIDPDGEAFTAHGRRRVSSRGKPLQKSHSGTDTPAVAPQSPPPEAGVSMDSGGLLDIPDAELFRKVLGVYLTLDTPAERAEFVKHARAFVPGSSSKTKNNRR
jgi:transcriptional regulator with XRE-family HTH domain